MQVKCHQVQLKNVKIRYGYKFYNITMNDTTFQLSVFLAI